MTVESASFVSGLVPAYPPGSDSISEGDDHLRLIKSVLQGTFPNANAAMNGIHTGTSAPTSTSAGQLWFEPVGLRYPVLGDPALPVRCVCSI